MILVSLQNSSVGNTSIAFALPLLAPSLATSAQPVLNYQLMIFSTCRRWTGGVLALWCTK